MTIFLILIVIILLALLVLLVMRLLEMRKEDAKRMTGAIVLNGGRSVNTEVIRENMGNGILNEHREENLDTLPVTFYEGAGRKQVIRLTDSMSGEVYQTVFYSQVIIGSNPDPSVPRLVIHKKGISRVHCRLYQQGDSYVIEDCNSTNHTWLNGQRLYMPGYITTGAVLKLGDMIFRVEIWMEA